MRKLAIHHLEQIEFEPIEKIATYKQYAVENDLLFPSYVTLCTSPTLPSPAEGSILTLETVLRLASARERVLLRASELGCKTPTIASAPEDVVRAVIAEIFGLTLHSNDKTVRMEGQGKNTEVVTVKQPNPDLKKSKVNGSASQGSPKNVASQVSQGNFHATAHTHDIVRMMVVPRFVRSILLSRNSLDLDI